MHVAYGESLGACFMHSKQMGYASAPCTMGPSVGTDGIDEWLPTPGPSPSARGRGEDGGCAEGAADARTSRRERTPGLGGRGARAARRAGASARERQGARGGEQK